MPQRLAQGVAKGVAQVCPVGDPLKPWPFEAPRDLQSPAEHQGEAFRRPTCSCVATSQHQMDMIVGQTEGQEPRVPAAFMYGSCQDPTGLGCRSDHAPVSRFQPNVVAQATLDAVASHARQLKQHASQDARAEISVAFAPPAGRDDGRVRRAGREIRTLSDGRASCLRLRRWSQPKRSLTEVTWLLTTSITAAQENNVDPSRNAPRSAPRSPEPSKRSDPRPFAQPSPIRAPNGRRSSRGRRSHDDVV